jgi:CHAT domain-containing protein
MQSVTCSSFINYFLPFVKGIKHLLLPILCCVCSYLHAQTLVQDTVLARQYMNRAKDCIGRSHTDSAKLWHRQALDLYQKHNVTDRWYQSYRELAEKWVKEKQPFVALEYLTSVIREKKSVTRTMEESGKLMSLCMYSGFVCETETYDMEGAKENYEEAFQLFVNDLGENNIGTADWLYRSLGNIYTRLSDFDRAQKLLQRGIDYGKKVGKPEIGKYGDLAIALNAQGKYREALEAVQEGLAVPGMPANALITTQLSEAQVWLYLGDPQKALEATKKAPALIEQIPDGRNKYNYLGGYHTRLGDIKSALGNMESAIENYRKSVEFETLAWGAHSREVGKNHYAIGECYFRKNKLEEALQAYQQTLQSVLPDFQPQSLGDNPTANLFEKAENTIIQGLDGKARCFEALGDFDKALECYELIPLVEAKLLATHAFESSSLQAVEASRPRFDIGIGLAWDLYGKSNDAEYARRAFHLTEQARGILLMKTIAQAQADYKLADSVRRREYAFKIKLAWYEQQIPIESNVERLNLLDNERFLLVQEQNRFRAELAAKDPVYRNLSQNITFRTTSDVPRLLRPGQALINYYLTEKTAYIFLLDAKGALIWRKSDLPAHFRDSTIQRFIDYLANGQGEGDETSLAEDAWLKKNAFELYERLLAPVLSGVPAKPDALVIAPDDVLTFLPFDLLQYEESQAEWSDAKFPFLLRNYSISYAYSATVLQRQQANTREHSATTRIPYAGFAPTYKRNERDPQDTGRALNTISDVKELVEAAQKMFGGKVFVGDEANEPEFGNTAPTCRVLLLAMHGFANEEKPALSRLLFGNPQSSGEPDNVLYTDELQITYLPADLVVLNACYTGKGKLQHGEGVYSVTRALTSAGVPAALMSIWELNGASSSALMQMFFQNIKSGAPKDLALQQAKIEFLKNPANESMWHPSFWAGVLATGDTTALKF